MKSKSNSFQLPQALGLRDMDNILAHFDLVSLKSTTIIVDEPKHPRGHMFESSEAIQGNDGLALVER